MHETISLALLVGLCYCLISGLNPKNLVSSSNNIALHQAMTKPSNLLMILEDAAYSNKLNNSNLVRNYKAAFEKYELEYNKLKESHGSWEDASEYLCHKFDSYNNETYEMKVDGKLPDICSKLVFCNSSSCIKYEQLIGTTNCSCDRPANKRAALQGPYCADGDDSSYKQYKCHEPYTVFNMTSELQAIQQGKKQMNSSSIFKGFYHFNLPGYRYCGPGTSIRAMDRIGGPVNELDAACRSHDISYGLATSMFDIEKADMKLMEEVSKTGSRYFPAFYFTFHAKQIFENLYNEAYTSFLYIDDPTSDISYQDYLQFEEKGLPDNEMDQELWVEGMNAEAAWSNFILNEWKEECDADEAVDADDERPCSSRGRQIPTMEGTQHHQPESVGTECEVDVTPGQTPNPKTRAKFKKNRKLGPCEVLLSEIYPNNNRGAFQFIEVGKICPQQFVADTTNSLTGYALTVTRISHHPAIISYVDPNGRQMVDKIGNEGEGEVKRSLFTVGTLNAIGTSTNE